jgi:trans-aconitate methyltransferase
MVSNMNEKNMETVLDFGCGTGFNTKNVILPSLNGLGLTHDTRIYAIDISKKMIEFASVKYAHPNVTYMVADVMKDDCEFPCKFDKIFSLHVLHWISDQE